MGVSPSEATEEDMTPLEKFTKWLKRAKRGSQYVYHVGSLWYDRERASWRPDYREVDAVGKAAWDAMLAKQVALTQRKTEGQFRFEYRATAR